MVLSILQLLLCSRDNLKAAFLTGFTVHVLWGFGFFFFAFYIVINKTSY